MYCWYHRFTVLLLSLSHADVLCFFHLFRECLNLIPHNKFSFAKIWLLAAQFEIRQLNLKAARQILGNAIGKAPKDKVIYPWTRTQLLLIVIWLTFNALLLFWQQIFKKYIEIELQLGNIDRCRKLYEKYLEWSPENCYAWSKYAELERSLSETERARGIFELAIAQPALDMPELLWKVQNLFLVLCQDTHIYLSDIILDSAWGFI